MSELVIKAEDLGKKYIISHQGKGVYKTFREQIAHHVRNVYTRTKRLVTGNQVLEGDEIEEFWALQNINFEIKQGERVGIIGRNGAGKSTLLKILSRITEPTNGKVSIKGRVASLLEVGTGFHPELTGRENIFLNGAILGMTRSEIKKKFDEIVDFSGVEKFLDTPVKRYSSGMYVRLAFAIAAHLESEILIVDEVLAVGDAEFQRKCLGKMEDITKKEGRMMVFVSHNMGAVSQLCTKAIMLQSGKLAKTGNTEQVIDFYLSSLRTSSDNKYVNVNGLKKDIYIKEIEITDENGNNSSIIKHEDSFILKCTIHVDRQIQGAKLGVGLENKHNNRIFSEYRILQYATNNKDDLIMHLKIPGKLLAPNIYSFSIALLMLDNLFIDVVYNICPFTITDSNTTYAKFEGVQYYGDIIANCEWY